MPTFKVWDKLNGEREYARDITADSPQHAAELYAEADESGCTDGLYIDCAQPIEVEADGTVHHCWAQAVFTRRYQTWEVAEPGDKP